MKLASKITPCLWFDGEAEAAAAFYTSIFKNSKIVKVNRYTDAGKETHRRPPGSVMTVAFEIAGQSFTALNGGPLFKFNEAVSFQVMCESQEEIDDFWKKLTEKGEPSQCGWLKDRFGVSWQVVPSILPDLLSDADSGKASRVMQAALKMQKFDIAALEKAAM